MDVFFSDLVRIMSPSDLMLQRNILKTYMIQSHRIRFERYISRSPGHLTFSAVRGSTGNIPRCRKTLGEVWAKRCRPDLGPNHIQTCLGGTQKCNFGENRNRCWKKMGHWMKLVAISSGFLDLNLIVKNRNLRYKDPQKESTSLCDEK